MASLSLSSGTLEFYWQITGLGSPFNTTYYTYAAVATSYQGTGISSLSYYARNSAPSSRSAYYTPTYTTSASAGTYTFYGYVYTPGAKKWYYCGSASVVVQPEETLTGTITAYSPTVSSFTISVQLSATHASSVYMYNPFTSSWSRIEYSSYQTSYTYTKTGLTAGGTYLVYLYDATTSSGNFLDSDSITLPNLYTLTYDKNGGSGTATGGSYEGGTSIHLASALTKSSSTTLTTSFNGNGATSPSSQSSTMTATYPWKHWLRSTDSVTYSGGAYMTMPYADTTMKAIFGSATYSYSSITLPSVSRSGYQFDGWYNSSGTYVGDAGDTYTPKSTATLTAYWTKLYTYTVNYSANGGSGAPSSDTYGPTTSTSHTFTLNTSTTPTRSGYRFLGWGASSGASTVITTIECNSSYTSKTVYAIWQLISYTYTITYKAGTGTGSDVTRTHTGSSSSYTATLLGATFTKAYSTQTGWNTASDGSGTAYSLSGSITLSANITLYATYTHNTTTNFYWLGSESADGNATTGIVQGASVTNMTATAWKSIGTKIRALQSLLGDTQSTFTTSMTSGSVIKADYYNEVTDALNDIVDNHSLNISVPSDTAKGNRLFYYLFNGSASIKQCLNNIIAWYNTR